MPVERGCALVLRVSPCSLPLSQLGGSGQSLTPPQSSSLVSTQSGVVAETGYLVGYGVNNAIFWMEKSCLL